METIMKQLNFKVQALLARILVEKSVAHGTVLFVRDELRARRSMGNK